MLNREYVMLAITHKDLKKVPKGYLWSTKYDGMRATWIPSCRGLRVEQVPYCHDLVPDRTCTGLFSRYGKVIHAPDSFLNQLPSVPLDGELFTGRNDFQRLLSIVRSHSGRDWEPVMFMAFDSPRYTDLFTDGRINNNIVKDKMIVSTHNAHLVGPNLCDLMTPFKHMYTMLAQADFWNQTVRLVQQFKFTQKEVEEAYEKELEIFGEGLIGRDPEMCWVPKRTKSVVKLKPFEDDEGTITSYTAGEGKHLGRLGSYEVTWKGRTFNLSGMTDAQRENPLPLGTVVTFRYRTLTEDNKPREARFVRERIRE